MRYLALASDYDGTLATHGTLPESTLDAVDQLRRSGRKFLLVTGRRLEELLEVFPAVKVCDMVVVENGALLYNPATGEERPLAAGPSATKSSTNTATSR
ncbi:MAG: HAD-IIB family hydrolase [Thermoguttaceae bacterium]|nr:HAD-IIB family hydrolase [Thermoguttaceae bacterium]